MRSTASDSQQRSLPTYGRGWRRTGFSPAKRKKRSSCLDTLADEQSKKRQGPSSFRRSVLPDCQLWTGLVCLHSYVTALGVKGRNLPSLGQHQMVFYKRLSRRNGIDWFRNKRSAYNFSRKLKFSEAEHREVIETACRSSR